MREGVSAGKEALDYLRKAGKALIVFQIRAHPDDDQFDPDNPPAADVYLVPHDPSEPPSEEQIQRHCKGSVPCVGPLEVDVDPLGGRLRRLFDKESRKRKAVLIVLEPRPPWDSRYKRIEYPRFYEPGGPYTENIYFEPKARDTINGEQAER